MIFSFKKMIHGKCDKNGPNYIVTVFNKDHDIYIIPKVALKKHMAQKN